MDFSSSVINRFSRFDSIKHLRKMLGERTAHVFISPLSGSSKSLVLMKLFETENQIVVLFPGIKYIEEFQVELDILNLTPHVITITEYKPEDLQEKLTDISKKEKLILLADYSILNCELPSKERIEQSITKISAGSQLGYNEIIEYLNLLNYQKDKFVEAPGDYSLRGSIIDFWSYSEKYPVRLEFDGDFLESIRYFDPESQRSIDNIETATLAGSLINQQGRETSDIFSYLKDPLVFASSYELHSIDTSKFNCFKVQESPAVISEEVTEKIIPEDEFPEALAVEAQEVAITILNNNIDALINTENKRWLIEDELGASADRIDLGLSDSPAINSNYEILFNILQGYSADHYEIIITSENELQSERLKDLLSQFRDELARLIDTDKVRIETLAIKKGFISKSEKFLLLTDYEIFNKPYRTKIIKSRKYKKSKSKAFASIKKGDYVVHEDYGIGKYAGLETIKIGEANQESMKILYNEGGVVYVNLNYLTLVKKYSSNENLTPSLSTLGTGDWVSIKRKTKKKIKEAARELIELYAKRKATKGYTFNPDTVWQKELEASFLYEDTPDQAKVTEEIKGDMEAESPMDRLVCGDVGFGKTEVAVRAAFKAVQDNKQAALLVPTTILAEQHYNTFNDRLSQFPIKVAVISRFQTRKQQTEILKDLEEGKVDILIGTHRLLSKDVKFKDLGILIIDEEHRFGVMAKEKLRSLKENVDTLTLTATPIPRTLNLSLLGARDLSIIATPPPNRQPIYTTVSVFDVLKIKEWITNELRRSGQIYFVHDRVQSIDKLAGYLHKYMPDLRVAIAHGQMKPAQLEEVIHGFLNRKFDLLLSTKIIESGIDIPNVNTIIVNRADRFGLAELHQLRGRVGRSNKQAYSYFIVPSLNGISKKALRRLQAIEEFTDVGAGFSLSMRDLEIRGAGNLLGTQQSGFINDVGFDLYVKMINEAVEELKYLEFKEIFKDLPKTEEKTEPTIDTFFDIGIPQEYMPEQIDRLNFYTALYSINNITEIDELKDEIIDRFGPLPIIVKRLIAAATLKYYASRALFERIIIQRKYIFIILPREQKEEYYKVKFIELMRFILDNYKTSVKFSQQKDVMKLVITNNFENPDKISDFLIKFSIDIMKLFNNKPIESPVPALTGLS
ncbi:MAG: transcription-repair coupling factor [Ignavibacteriaceae bacterium]|nr:transcription-repair coupling factor [Ignavibacteriaceae bacterium]